MLKARNTLQCLCALLWPLTAAACIDAQAHEFWVEPVRFEVAVGGALQARLRLGQEMKGEPMSFIPQRLQAFNLTIGDDTRPVRSRIGDDPAVNETVNDSGLVILSYVSTDSKLTYSEAERFDSFLAYEGIGWVKAAHLARGLPAQGFSEAYQRFAKSLVKVGDGSGNDRALGLALELVVETNPYVDRGPDIVVQLLWQGHPLTEAQVNVFRRHDGKVSRTPLQTDAQGRIRIPRQATPGVYLLNAVQMIEPAPNDGGVVWKSLWASTTFEVMQ